MKERMDRERCISRHSRHFLSIDNKISTFPFLYLELASKHLCFPQEKGINERNGSTFTFKNYKL